MGLHCHLLSAVCVHAPYCILLSGFCCLQNSLGLMDLTPQSFMSNHGVFGASLVAQLVMNLPAMQETWVQFLGWEDPLEKEMATHSSILEYSVLENPMDRGAWQAIVHGVARVGHDLVTKPPPPWNLFSFDLRKEIKLADDIWL